mgnify:CR=1 FL=1
MKKLLCIDNLNVFINDKKILDGVNLDINMGEVHVIMGPNGSGKSTFAKVLAGDRNDLLIEGKVIFDGFDVLSLPSDELSLRGIFLGFQYPISIPGLTNIQFFKSFVNNKRKFYGMLPVDVSEFNNKVKLLLPKLNIKEDFLYRFVNDGFSGGEKKRNEVLQMLLLEPKLSILDEIDSGLDVDSLKDVCGSINLFNSKEKSTIIITHYNRILNYINVDYVHILKDGKIVKTGDKNLALEIEDYGYYSFL